MRHEKITMLLILIITVACLCATFAANVYAQDPSFECGTDPELMQQLHSQLVQKKFGELSRTPLKNNGISTFSQFTGYKAEGLMPSTGNVRILVLPIEFADKKIDRDIYAELPRGFFEEYDASKPMKELSVKGRYQKLSYGKLNITGDILPIYTADKNMNECTDYEELITQALDSYPDINYDDYDSDKDGYIDCLFIEHADSNATWHSFTGTGLAIKPKNANGKRFFNVAMDTVARSKDTLFVTSGIVVHEIGHMLGLPDNYDTENSTVNCLLERNLEDIMAGGESCAAGYFNIYHRYLLDWVEPEILPYTDTLQNIELNAVETYTDETADNNKAVIFIPDNSLLPFSEFYMAEYRAGGLEKFYTDNPGIVLWHCRASVNSYGQYIEPNNYIKPVYKSGGTIYAAEDVYTTGDEFSNLTNPSSKFADDIYTGAYMKVLSQDSQKATISAGFIEPDLTPAPSITISPPSKKAVKSSEMIKYTVTYENAESISLEYMYLDLHSLLDTAQLSYSISLTGNPRTITIKKYLSGEGEYWFTIPKKSAVNGAKFAPAVTSTTFYVDDTPPEIILNGNSEVVLAKGTAYTEQGAQITDNLDPDIESKLVINSSSVNTNQTGTYSVTYNATDHAGNTARQVVRTVKVQESEPTLTAEVQYSTTSLTNQDVTVTLVPSAEVTADTILSHTFTENGSYTFTLTDLSGNTIQISVEVTWIDKISPTADIEYSSTDPTNGDITARLVNISEDIKETDLVYTFTANGEHTFTITDLAGNAVDIAAKVTWIDKTAPTASIEYSTTNPTNGDVTAKLINISEEVQETELTYVFTENGEHTFTITDWAGNAASIIARVDWIDKMPPTADIEYSPTSPTNGTVTAKLINISEEVKETELSYTFTENGEYTFTITDQAGNTATIPARVTWIDKTAPQGTVSYSATEPTNDDVTATVSFDKADVTVTNNNGSTSYIFTENGEFTFEFTDALGNRGSATARVDWINKTVIPPVSTVEPIGKYSGKFKIEKGVNDKITFTITPVTGEKLPKFNLFVAEYDNTNKLIKIQTGQCMALNDTVIISADLPKVNKYKIMIWDEQQVSLIKAITKDII